jgi:hypothetical protein
VSGKASEIVPQPYQRVKGRRFAGSQIHHWLIMQVTGAATGSRLGKEARLRPANSSHRRLIARGLVCAKCFTSIVPMEANRRPLEIAQAALHVRNALILDAQWGKQIAIR